MAQKSNIRSMRFSDEIIQMIESQAGETFTAKFEALVQRCMWELPNKERELAGINEMIRTRREQLQDLNKQVSNYSKHINNIEYSIKSLERTIEWAIKETS